MIVRCRSCSSTLIAGETTCYTCGTGADQSDDAAARIGKRFAFITKIAFFASAVLTVVSPFTDFTPSFIKCLTTTVVLLFVSSSAHQMADKKGA